MTDLCTRLPQASVQLLDGAPFPEAHVPGSVRSVLTELRDRQEALFTQVLDQQKQFYQQLSNMHVAVQAGVDAQLASERSQEELLAKFNRLFFFKSGDSNHKPGAAETDQGDDASPDAGKYSFYLKSGEDQMMCSEADQGDNASVDTAINSHVTPKTEEDTGSNTDSSRKESVVKDGRNTSSLATSRFSAVSILSHDGFGPQSEFKRFLKSKEFEFAIALLIMANALVMCVESQYQGLDVGYDLQYPGRPVEAHIVWSGADKVFLGFDWIFGCLFFIEVIVKLWCWRCAYFYMPHALAWDAQDLRLPGWMLSCRNVWSCVQGWNLMDFSCVVAFCLDKMAPVGAIDPRTIRLLRLFRLSRMARLVRFLETMDHLYIMTTAIASVRHVLFWAIMLLAIMLLMCDLLLVQILHATYFDRVKAEDLTEPQLLKHHQMYEYFGTSTRCLLSMFELTLGNWPPVVRLLSEEVSEWFTLICLLHKLTIGFAVINVISGVIMQQTFKVAQTDNMKAVRSKLKALFKRLDTSGDGRLEMSEVEELSNLPDIKIWLGSYGIETDDIETFFKVIDDNGDGYVTFEEMMSQMPRLQGHARSLDLLALRHEVRDHVQRSDKAFDAFAKQLAKSPFL